MVPAGERPSTHTPFFADESTFVKLRDGTDNIANVTGLPNQSAASAFDAFSVTPKKGQRPTIFKSEIAPIEQGSVKRSGGEQQVIVPERGLFEDPVFEETIKERF